MKLLLISTYELGRQPVHVASPAARLRDAGHRVQTLDLAVEPWNETLVDWADAVAISTPMHTATRLAIGVVERIRSVRPDVPLAAYGLYAAMAIDEDGSIPFDRAIVGEYEESLVRWADQLAPESPVGPDSIPISVHLDRGGFRTPDRSGLPPLTRYAHLADAEGMRVVGAVEASHGCRHLCRHCPIPVVYDGSFRIVDPDVVLADIDQLVESGATHITFGDPDFLNGPAHALRIARGLHLRYPDVTFDCTVKVEHIINHADIWPEMGELGCIFVVSAFESMNDTILDHLDKGHSAADAARSVHILREAGIDIRPSWLPFTPWTERADIDAMFRFISAHDLVDSTDPVQMGIRLLIPRGSLMLEIEGIDRYLGSYDATTMSYAWTPDDPSLDELSDALMRIAEDGARRGTPVGEVFLAQWLAVVDGTDLEQPAFAIESGATVGRPRLTESWFC